MALAPVYVTNAPNGLITQTSINAGIQARVTVPPTTQYGDLVQFFWGSVGPLERFYNTESFPNFTWIINIQTAFPQQEVLSDGDYAVQYTITDFVGNVSPSDRLDITVVGSSTSNPTYVAPIAVTTPPNIINQATWVAGFPVNIPSQTAILAGDTFVLFLRANETIITQIGSGAFSAPTEPPVPTVVMIETRAPAFAGLDGVQGFIYYTVSRGGSLLGTSSSQQVYIDVVPPGGL